MKKHIPTTESGRSMVEMLGVLAIMGVLSIGAVAGYRWAMDKRNANEILNEVRKRAITSSQARISGHEIDLTEYGDNGRINGKYGVVADNAYNGDDRFFTLTVSDIPQGVCDKVVDVNWQMPAAILLDGVAVDDNTVCGEGNNEMLFAFANDLKSGAVAGGDTAQPERPNTDANGDCLAGYVGENCDIRDTTCQGHGVFAPLDDFAMCFCDPGFGGNNCEVTCPNKNYPFEGFDLSTGTPNGSCYSCSATTFLTGEACHTCPNRFLVSEGSISACVSCSWPIGMPTTDVECAKCDKSSTPREMRNGICIIPGYCPEGFLDTSGSCSSCSVSYSATALEAECAKCDKSSTPRFMSTDGYCRSCSDSLSPSASADECAKCEGSSTPRFMAINGSCYSCSDSSSPSTTAAECAKCDDSSTPRVLLENGYCALEGCGANQFQSTDGYCYPCSASYGVSATKAECAKCDKSDTPRFMDTNGSCRSCSDSYGVSATKTECAKCDKSSTPREMRNGYCILPGYCPEGFLSSDGSCRSCSDSTGRPATAAECAQCDDTDTPRFMTTNGYCHRCSASAGVSTSADECAKCDDSSTPRFIAIYGECYPCSYSNGVPTNADECAMCDASSTPRYMNGSRCYKCPTSLSSGSLNTQEKCESCHGRWDAETKKCS